MKTIILTGRLAKKFGRNFNMDVSSVNEAVKALCIMVEGFEQELRKGAYRVIRCYPDGRRLSHSEHDLDLGVGKANIIRIEPALVGAKSGIFQIILGVVLVGAAFLLTGGTLSATAFSAFGYTVTGGQLALVGGLMAVSGAASMLAAQAMKPESVKERSSYGINSPSNYAEQGHPVPLVYGRCFVGSVVIHQSITTEDFESDE